MTLSKSNYLTYLKHPVWLWLEKHDKGKLPEVTEDVQALFDAGNIFEKYAEESFPDGVTLGYKTDGEFDGAKYTALPEKTQKAIDEKVHVLFQGRLEIDGTTCIFDVLEANSDGTYNLYEIKASSKAKPEHIHDLAFQKTVLEKAGLKIGNISVVHVDNTYVRDGDIDSKQIATKTDVTKKVEKIMGETAVEIEEAKKVLVAKEMPNPSPRYARMGALKEWISIYRTLNTNIPKYSIYDLYKSGASRLGDFEDAGILTIQDIPADANITPVQNKQVQTTQLGQSIIDKDEIRKFLKNFEFPAYFLDYETFSNVMPPYDGTRPYQQVPFQYSLHVLESPEGELIHKEYLHTENTLPVEDVVKHLKDDIREKGSVVVWSSFEKQCHGVISEIAPEHTEFMDGLNERIVDLMAPFAKGWYTDKDFFGGSSIKYILPALVPSMSYGDLNIKGGNTAQRVWMQTVIDERNPEKKDKVMNDLIKYCTRDTLAMVEIWRVLRNVVEGK